jgi:uncharacterized protein YrzB (UPF0473 family)
MNDNYDEQDTIITLNDEDGNDVQFEFLDLVEYNSEEFVVLLPVDDEDGMVVILKIESLDTDDDTETYTAVDDDTALAVFQIFKERYKDELDFEE